MNEKFHKRRKEYYDTHEDRYKYCVKKINDVLSERGKIMDIGSKFMHQASMMSKLGHEVHAYDTKYITEIEEIRNIANKNDVKLKTISDLAKGKVAEDEDNDTFDALIMSEVLEHLAFNPLPMWKQLIKVLKPNSYIFISTPNSLNMKRRVVQTARILAGVGVGITVDGIFSTPTYGHHWKEYSIYEIKEYFGKIGIPKRNIEIDTYSYRPYHERGGIRYNLENILRKIGNKTDRYADEILATIQVPQPKPSVPSSPSYA
jgi:2-polyprenyl-6-hydroxyphenyl methylase/3-demethylubiquinone-9 3-methyltransferase